MWILTNIQGKGESIGDPIKKVKGFLFYGDTSQFIMFGESNPVYIYIDGFIIPRFGVYEDYKKYPQNDLITILYEKYGLNFIDKIKGSFNIIVFERDAIHIYNDQHSFSKFFYSDLNGKIIISSDIEGISKLRFISINKETTALFAIMEHFINGYTLFEDLYFSIPATHMKLNLNGQELHVGNYFNPLELIENTDAKGEITDINDMAELWSGIISGYIEYLKPRGISLTLTGGNDSRMILAALLHNDINFTAFSFGNPESFDGVVAAEISKTLRISYDNHYVCDPTKKWFKDYAAEIINKGNSLINIHRAHRLNAIATEKERHPDTDMLFCGFMGGDYVKGLIYDDYITPRILRKYEGDPKKSKLRGIIIEELNRCKINPDNIYLEKLEGIISDLPMMNHDSRKIREFLVLFHLIGSMHDMQDTTIFKHKVKYVINPFMDVDFMQFLFGSDFSFLKNNNDFLWQTLRWNRSRFHLQITDYLATELSKIKYAKKGHYNANEYINDNTFLLMVKRFIRKNSDKKYPQNFPYGNWIKEFCQEELFNIDGVLTEVFNIRDLLDNLSNNDGFPTTEGFWHLFTNPVNLYLNLKKFQTK
ncbi:MAG: hypothetical protein GX660_12205 [Clostridiaceae bacterium]|nr:hypothetical protein [Clostridiaceae bacterium]